MSDTFAARDVGAFTLAAEKGAARKRLHMSAGTVIGISILVAVVCLTVGFRLAGIGNPNQIDLSNTLAAPSAAHLFGTDALGRDVFARTVYASALDLGIGVVTTIIPLVLGMALGVLAGYFEGWTDAVVMRAMDAVLAFPFIVLIIAFVTIFGVGLTGVYIGLTVASVPFFARITRAEMLVLREQQFIQAARTLGYSDRRIVFKHSLPHLLPPNLVFAPSNALGNILALAALSYLGLGAQPPQPEWGAIIASGQPYLLSAWWISTLPGVFVVIVGIGFSLTGEGLVDRLLGTAGKS
jgi:peptide/nickel transport system permease protein